jgi:hypothetical protein
MKFPFDGDKQSGTGFSKNLFRQSFSRVPDEAATDVSSALREKQASEALGEESAPIDKHM